MPSQTLRFQNQRGETLSAHLDAPARPVAYALFAHCLPLSAVHALSQALKTAGFAVLGVDLTGLEETEGFSYVHSLMSAANLLKGHYQAPSLLVGHASGGAAVLMAATQLESVRAVATIGTPVARVAPQHIAQLRRPLMILHSPLDMTVGIENAAGIYQLARHPKSFVSLDQADHVLSREQDARYAGQMIAAWAMHYLDLPEQQQGIHAHTEQGYRTEIMAEGFQLLADEPLRVGGSNTGPTPIDYLSVALASCTSMTLRMYADRKKLPVECIDVSVKHSKQPAGEGLKIDHFQILIAIEGDIDIATRARMLEISERCPVHRVLASEVSFQAELV